MISTQLLVNSFNALINQSSDINTLNEHLCALNELVLCPEIFNPLLIIAQTHTSLTYRNYALVYMKVALTNLKDTLDQESIKYIQAKIVEMLALKDLKPLKSAIISIISVLIDLEGNEWPELIEYIFSGQADLDYTLLLLTFIIQKMDEQQLNSYFDTFIQLIINGLQSPQTSDQSAAMKLLSFLMMIQKREDIYESLQNTVLTSFVNILNLNDPKALSEFIEPIFIGYDENIELLNFESIVPIIIPILQNQDFSFDFRDFLHFFFVCGLFKHPNFGMSEDNFQALFQIENMMAYSFLENYDDQTLIKLFDVEMMYCEIFKRIPSQRVFDLTFQQTVSFLQEDNDISRSISYIILEIVLMFTKDQYLSHLNSIYDSLVQSLLLNGTISQLIAIRVLNSKVKIFIQQITDNTPELIASVIKFIKEQDIYEGSSLLKSLSEIIDSDLVFNEVYNICFELMQHEEVQTISYTILSNIISNSTYQAYFQFEEIFQVLVNKIESSNCLASPHSLVFSSLAGLCLKHREKAKEKINEIMALFIHGMSAESSFALFDILVPLETIISEFDRYCIDYFRFFIDPLLRHMSKDWDKKLLLCDGPKLEKNKAKFEIACLSCEVASRFAVTAKDKKLCQMILKFIENFIKYFQISSTGIISSMSSIEILSDLFHDDPYIFDSVIQQALQVFNVEPPDFKLIESVITTVGRLTASFSTPILGDNEPFFIINIKKLLLFYYDPTSDDYEYQSSIFEKIELILPIVLGNSISIDLYLEEFINIFNKMLSSDSSHVQSFALKIIGSILEIKCLSEDDKLYQLAKTTYVQIVLQSLNNPVPSIVEASLLFIMHVVRSSNIIIMSDQILTIFQALYEILNLLATSENVIKKIAELVSIDLLLINEKFGFKDFPFDQYFELVKNFLPISCDTPCSEFVLIYLTNAYPLLNESSKSQFIILLVKLFGQPMDTYDSTFDTYELMNVISLLRTHLPQEGEDLDNYLLEVFENEQGRIDIFKNAYKYYLEETQNFMSKLGIPTNNDYT